MFIPLDIFRGITHNKLRNKTEAWLTFLSKDEPEIIIKLISQYPEFKEMYEEIYVMCQNVEKVMEMFSKELIQLDRNTVQYMIDEMQETNWFTESNYWHTKEELEAARHRLREMAEKLETAWAESKVKNELKHSPSDNHEMSGGRCFPLYACSREIIKRYTPFLEKIDLTYTQYIAMMVLWEKKANQCQETGQMPVFRFRNTHAALKKIRAES